MHRRTVAAALSAIVLLAVCGCAAPGPGELASKRMAGPQPVVTVAAGLPFDASPRSGTHLEWVTVFGGDEYRVDSATDTGTTWVHVRTGCEVSVLQAGFSDDSTAMSDRARSDALLAALLGQASGDVTKTASDYQTPLEGGGTLAMRALRNTHASGWTELTLARVAVSIRTQFAVSAYCPPGEDPSAEIAALEEGALSLSLAS